MCITSLALPPQFSFAVNSINRKKNHTHMDREKHVMAGGDDTKATTNIPSSSSTSSCVNENKNSKLYKGVRKRKWGKWVSEIRLPNSRERIWLGSFDSAEKAARAFDAALYCLRGRHATFNFPDTPYNVALPPHQSLTPQEIQEVASKFANEVCVNQQQQNQQHGTCGDGDGNCNSSSLVESISNINTPTTTASSCSTMLECDGTVQVENGDNMMDWTFLNVFDYSNEVVPVASDYSLYSELDKITMHSGELLYSTPPPPTTTFDDDDDDPFSHQSFLWNWNF